LFCRRIEVTSESTAIIKNIAVIGLVTTSTNDPSDKMRARRKLDSAIGPKIRAKRIGETGNLYRWKK
jgi:hypothetical protein